MWEEPSTATSIGSGRGLAVRRDATQEATPQWKRVTAPHDMGAVRDVALAQRSHVYEQFQNR